MTMPSGFKLTLTVFLGLACLIFWGCKPALSDLMEEKVNPQLVENLLKTADTVIILSGKDSLYSNLPPIWVKGQKLLFLANRQESNLWYDEQGNLSGLIEKKAMVTTDSIAFHPNGQRMFTLLFDKQGRPSGPARYYYPDGRVKADGRFENGIKTGIWRNFNEVGKLVFTEEYDRYGIKKR